MHNNSIKNSIKYISILFILFLPILTYATLEKSLVDLGNLLRALEIQLTTKGKPVKQTENYGPMFEIGFENLKQQYDSVNIALDVNNEIEMRKKVDKKITTFLKKYPTKTTLDEGTKTLIGFTEQEKETNLLKLALAFEKKLNIPEAINTYKEYYDFLRTIKFYPQEVRPLLKALFKLNQKVDLSTEQKKDFYSIIKGVYELISINNYVIKLSSYTTLEIDKDATQEDIEKAYKKLSTFWNPDLHSNDTEFARRKFLEMRVAYNILSNHQNRNTYNLQNKTLINDGFSINEL